MTNVRNGAAISLHLLTGDPYGPRIAETRTSPLRVFGARWNELGSLLDLGLPAAPAVYLLTRPSVAGHVLLVRPGEAGDIRRRLQEHALDRSKTGFFEVYCLTSVDSRLSKPDIRYLEARLHELVAAAPHSALEVDKVPGVGSCSPADRDVLEALLKQGRVLLHAAGCRALDAEGLPFGTSPDPDPDDGSIAIGFDIPAVGDGEHELNYDGIWARGFHHDSGFVVRAGSDIRRRENTALLPPMADRRRFLGARGVLGEIPGVADRWRLLVNVQVPSSLIAAKVVTGAHVSTRGIWRRLPDSGRLIVSG